jgi:dolichyl-phosphate beta-glucosyltransferase
MGAIPDPGMIRPIGKLSVVVPAFNEAERLGPTLDRVLSFLDDRLPDYEVIVVDDGSTDATTEVVARRMLYNPRVRILRNPGNRGKGYSVRRGMLEAAGAAILMTDADLSTPIEELLSLTPHIGRCEVVIGSRATSGARILRHQPVYREWMGKTFNRMVQALVLPGVQDTQCGFKLFRRDAARAIFSRATIDGFGFDVEALYLARRLGFKVAEVPVTWIDNPATKVSAVRDGARMAADLVRIRLTHRRV